MNSADATYLAGFHAYLAGRQDEAINRTGAGFAAGPVRAHILYCEAARAAGMTDFAAGRGYYSLLAGGSPCIPIAAARAVLAEIKADAEAEGDA